MRKPRHEEKQDSSTRKGSHQRAWTKPKGRESRGRASRPDLRLEAQSRASCPRLLAMASVVFLLLVCVPHAVWSEDSASALSLNLTPQNERIGVFCGSWGREPMGTQLGIITGREVESYIIGAANAGAVLSSSSRYEDDKFGIIVTDFGSHDRLDDLPWEVTDNDLRQLFQSLKGSGAIVVYNEIVPESYGFPYGEVCREEGVILVPNITQGIGLPRDLNPWFFGGDVGHPIEEAYYIFAERTAEVLVDYGLAQHAWTFEAGQIPAVFSLATDLINAVEERGADTQLAMKYYDLAEYIWDTWNHEYSYAVNRSLHERIIGPLESCLAGWDQVTELFDTANASIATIEEAGMTRETILMKADYSRAQKAWTEYDIDATGTYLDKVLAKAAELPEPALLPILALPLLIAIRCGTRGNRTRSTMSDPKRRLYREAESTSVEREAVPALDPQRGRAR